MQRRIVDYDLKFVFGKIVLPTDGKYHCRFLRDILQYIFIV